MRKVAFAVAFVCALGAQPRYIDGAEKSRFSYTTQNGFDGKRKYFPQPLCGGVAMLDFDNDGHLDLFLTNGAAFPELKKTAAHHNALLRNTGGGVFEEVTAKAGLAGEGYSLGAAAADFDNDGWTDLFVAGIGVNRIYRNNGNGTFREVTATAGLTTPPNTLSVQGAFLDYDNDGLLDLVVSNYTLWSIELDRRCVRTDGVDFYCHPKTYPAVAHRLYRNLGDGRYADVTASAGFDKAAGKGMGIGVADFNGDGWLDVFIANDTERNFFYRNRGDGTFVEDALRAGVAYNDDAATVSAMGVDVRDYDNDGWPDVFYNNLANQLWALFRNLGGRSFRYSSPNSGLAALSAPYAGWSAGFVDYNNDGWRDLFSANGDVDSLHASSPQHDTLFENAGGKRFVDVSRNMGEYFTRKGYQRGAAFGDLNNDGFTDLVVTSLGRRPAILLHTGGSGHWVDVKLRGRRSNRDSIGARVKVTTASGRVLHDWISPSVGFLSSSSLQTHFGLGAETRVDIEARWPSGVVARVTGTPVDRVVTMVEPD